MRDHKSDFDEAKIKVVVVGQGTPEMLGEFMANRRLPFDVYCDPTFAAYRAFGLERAGVWNLSLNPKVLAKGVKAATEGHVVTRVKGDAMQLPGSFVIRDGVIVYAHRGKMSSDIAPPEELLGALRD